MALQEISDFKRKHPRYGIDEEKEYRIYRKSYKISKIAGSSIKEKGILAVAGACCGEDAIDPIKTYLKTYYGYRAAQCKVLMAVLSWIDHYRATELLLKTSERFRTASIRKEAEKYVHLMAERRGWTIDELQDRTLPTGGFDENRTLQIDFGSRQFTISVKKDMKLSIRNEEEKVLKSLPSPGKNDDEELAAEAKKEFNKAKRAVGAIKKGESSRLHEAMLTQRKWRFSDWDRYLNRHPILSHYFQRIVWAEFGKSELQKKGLKMEGANEARFDGIQMAKRTFRPLDDYSLTDMHDEVVRIDDDSVVGIAHTMVIDDEDREGWLSHLKDYRIKPLLDQFPETVRTVDKGLENEVLIPTYMGKTINGVTLGRLLKKFGYVQGPMDSYDKFQFSFQKRIVGKGIDVNVEFTGRKMYEMDDTIALKNVYFTKPPGEGEDGLEDEHLRIPLSEVPPLLISETLTHMEAVVEKCEGYDPDWEKRYDLMSSE